MARTRRAQAVRHASRSQMRHGAGLLAAFVLGLAVAFVLGSWTTAPDATERRIAELEHAEAQRDVEQIRVLNDLARSSRERLTPLLTAMARTAPLDGTPGTVPTAEEVRGWQEVVSAEVRRYAESPSAGNGVNVARTGIRTAVRQLAAAVDGFEVAVTAAEPLRERLVTLAAEQRTLAVWTWSVAALQLDVINVYVGNGHIHVQLPSCADRGVIAADGEPERSGWRTPSK